MFLNDFPTMFMKVNVNVKGQLNRLRVRAYIISAFHQRRKVKLTNDND